MLISSTAQAHQLRPSIVDLSLDSGGRFQLSIETNLEALLSGIGPEHENSEDAPQAAEYDRLRALEAGPLAERFRAFEAELTPILELRFDGVPAALTLADTRIPPAGDLRDARLSSILYEGTVPTGAAAVDWRYPPQLGDSVLRVRMQGDPSQYSHWLPAGERSPAVAIAEGIAPQPLHEVAARYVVLGFTHILPLGVDHIVFVLGLFLLSLAWRPLLWQVTSFTLAHTITLGLTIYGYINLPATVVEPLIALSIAYVGIENLLTSTLKPWRVVVVFLFGLLHGMGFGGVLLDLGLPRNDFLTALISFNVGVELGQLSIIAGAFLLVGWLARDAAFYRRFVVVPGSLAIAAAGTFWFLQRI